MISLVATGIGIILGGVAFDTVDPHRALSAKADVVYVGGSCGVSQAALKLLGDAPIVPIPVFPEEVGKTTAPCAKALASLRANGSPLWSLVPDSVLCARLARGAKEHVANKLEGKIPAWSLRGTYLGAGLTDEIIKELQAHNILPANIDGAAVLRELMPPTSIKASSTPAK